MSQPNKPTVNAATDMVAALDSLRTCPVDAGQFFVKGPMTPDEAARDFVHHHAGMPATPRGGPEPAVIYRQQNTADLLFGLYGEDSRIKAWLPGLADGSVAEAAKTFAPIAPAGTESDHQFTDTPDITTLPIPKITARDAGRYITMGFVMAGGNGNDLALSAHRMLVLGPDLLGISMLTSRHLRHIAQRAWKSGRSLPISINIGVPPAVAIASATGTAHLPDGFDKLSLAGALAQSPIAVSQSPDGGCPYLTNSAFALHGSLLEFTSEEALAGATPDVTMPEFLGYDGHAGPPLQLIRVSAMSQRPDVPFQAVVGPGREQSAILGLGGALSIALALREQIKCIDDVRFSHAGGGMLTLFVALNKTDGVDLEALTRRMIDICPFTKMIIFVDDDVDLSSEEDVFWAMSTRSNLAQDCHSIKGFSPMKMDPSQGEAWGIAKGYTQTRCYVDATVPVECTHITRRSFSTQAENPKTRASRLSRILNGLGNLVPRRGLEPPRPYGH